MENDSDFWGVNSSFCLHYFTQLTPKRPWVCLKIQRKKCHVQRNVAGVFGASLASSSELRIEFLQATAPKMGVLYHLSGKILLGGVSTYVAQKQNGLRYGKKGGAPHYKWVIIPRTSSIYHQQKPVRDIGLVFTNLAISTWGTSL